MTETQDLNIVLSHAVQAVLSRWSALRLAVNNAGPQSGNEIANELVDDVTTLIISRVGRADIDDYLVVMEDAFNRLHTTVEDGSMTEVAEALLQIRDAAAHGDLRPAQVQINKKHAMCALPGVTSDSTMLQSDSSDDDEASDGDEHKTISSMDVDEKEKVSEPVVDDDGFQAVVRRRNRPR